MQLASKNRAKLAGLVIAAVFAPLLWAWFDIVGRTRSTEVVFVADSDVLATAFSGDGRSVVSISHRGVVAFIEVAKRRVSQTIRLSDYGRMSPCVPSEVRFSHDDRHMIVREATGHVHVFFAASASWAFLGTISPDIKRNAASDITLHPTRSELVLIGRHGELEKYLLKEQSVERTAVRSVVSSAEDNIPSQGWPFKVAYTENGQHLAVLVPSSRVDICDEADLRLVRTVEVTKSPLIDYHSELAGQSPPRWAASEIAMHDLSTLVLAASFPGRVGLIRLDDPKSEVFELGVSWNLMRICGKHVVSVDDQGDVFQLDVPTKRFVSVGRPCRSGGTWHGVSLPFDVSRDGKRIVTGKNTQVLIYDICGHVSNAK